MTLASDRGVGSSGDVSQGALIRLSGEGLEWDPAVPGTPTPPSLSMLRAMGDDVTITGLRLEPNLTTDCVHTRAILARNLSGLEI